MLSPIKSIFNQLQAGKDVTLNATRDVNLLSAKNTQYLDGKNESQGGSFTFGSMTGSGSISLSKDKMHSNYDSVQEQTGIFAGKGGFDVTVGEHTQLNGAVIGSTATADKNKLDTGTLGFKDIHNQADFDVEHQSVGISSGGSIGSQFAGNMANGLLVGANNSGHDSSTTHAAVSDGTIVIRDQDKQTQNVNDLSRDVEHANQTLSPIFDKEKEQKRLQQAQLIGEIGNQAMDIARTEGSIAATKAAKEKMNNVTDADRQAAAAKLAKEKPGKVITDDDINAQIYQTAYNQAFSESGYGTGGKVQRAMQAATAAVQGLSGGDLTGALANGAAPYITKVIADSIDDPAARVLAHAAVNGALAAAQGNNALVGAGGAATGELIGMIAINAYGKPVSELSETEKQTVSALATLAAGLAGGLIGDSTADAVAGAQTGKTVVENNAISDIVENKFSGITQEEKYQRAQDELKAAVEAYQQKTCAGLSPDACSAKLRANRDEMLKGAAGFGIDFVPVVGDIKSFAEAQSALDYLAATVGLIPVLGDGAGKFIKAAEKALEKGDVAEASKLINKASDEIVAVSGSKGNWSKELNNPQPNKTYKLDGNKSFKTDALGRTESIESSLSLSKNDRNTYQQCKAGKCGNAGDEGGHLIASIFNGPGEKLNLVPMDGNLNNGVWKQMENTWANALKDGKKVDVNIQPIYSGDSTRPDRFIVKYSIDNGRPVNIDFKNTPGGK
ncbi:DNA/RNA non-specific endonuclease [Serratia plymuthica]|nr:DNA/RNA non-specific endonuclease [Serratia plymuthica]